MPRMRRAGGASPPVWLGSTRPLLSWGNRARSYPARTSPRRGQVLNFDVGARIESRSMTTRRRFLTAGAGGAALALAPRALAQWQPSQRYPDPAVQGRSTRASRSYRLDLAKVERLATGFRWCEGPVWFGDGRYLLWSDIPNNRIMRWDEETGAVSVFRKPSNFANGNTRDRQGRLVTCEHGTRRVTRTEYDGTVTVDRRPLRGQAAQLAERRRVQVRRVDLVHRPAVRHPRLLRGLHGDARAADERLSRGRRRGSLTVVAGDVDRPNGLAFSPDESKLYVVEAGVHAARRSTPSTSCGGTRLTNKRTLHRRRPRHAGRPARATWTATSGCGWGMGEDGLDGVDGLQPRRASSSAASTCPSAAPTSASAAATATACSCAERRRSTRCT